MTFAGAAKGDSLVEGHIAANNGGFANHHAHGMVDEQATAQERTGVNIHASKKTSKLRKQPSQETHLGAPEKVRDAVNPYRP